MTTTERKTNAYTGQDARIVRALTTSTGKTLYALKTCATRPVATVWNDESALRRLATELKLNLKKD